jgi:hypothetical protein
MGWEESWLHLTRSVFELLIKGQSYINTAMKKEDHHGDPVNDAEEYRLTSRDD